MNCAYCDTPAANTCKRCADGVCDAHTFDDAASVYCPICIEEEELTAGIESEAVA